MESSTSTTRRRHDDARQREAEQSVPWPTRAWLPPKGKLLDESAYLAALGRGGAQRMAIPLGEA